MKSGSGRGKNGDKTQPDPIVPELFTLLQQGQLRSVYDVSLEASLCRCCSYFDGLMAYWVFKIQNFLTISLLCTVYIRWWNSVLERERIKRRRRRTRTLYSRLSKSPRGSWATTHRIRVGYSDVYFIGKYQQHFSIRIFSSVP